jgi:hypothetical protein
MFAAPRLTTFPPVAAGNAARGGPHGAAPRAFRSASSLAARGSGAGYGVLRSRLSMIANDAPALGCSGGPCPVSGTTRAVKLLAPT